MVHRFVIDPLDFVAMGSKSFRLMKLNEVIVRIRYSLL